MKSADGSSAFAIILVTFSMNKLSICKNCMHGLIFTVRLSVNYAIYLSIEFTTENKITAGNQGFLSTKKLVFNHIYDYPPLRIHLDILGITV